MTHSLVPYLQQYAALEKPRDHRVAVLSSFTMQSFKEIYTVVADQLGLSLDVYMAGYNQISQELFDVHSGLYHHAPSLVIIFQDIQSVLGEYWHTPYAMTQSQLSEWIEQTEQYIVGLVEQARLQLSARIVIHDFEVPEYSPYGILENKQAMGIVAAVEIVNQRLRERYADDSQVFVFAYHLFCARIGTAQLRDQKMYYLADMKLDLQHFPALAHAYCAYCIPLAQQTKKCIVLDLDNTLWGGIIGEDGIDGIALGPEAAGRPFWEFQKTILALYQRGVILAINSKNNYEDAIQVLRTHPYMVLQEHHFAAVHINWNDKATNLEAIAKELNIGLDALVFFDDDHVNRELVRSLLPTVLVPELPSDPALYSTAVRSLVVFNSFQLTSDDVLRGQMYAEQRQRHAFQQSVVDMDGFLTQLDITVTAYGPTDMYVARIAQLTQKTNQFNFTTRRYSEYDIQSMIDQGYLVFCVAVSDRFGDNGVTGVMIVDRGVSAWRIDTFLLSCRVIGRKIEMAMLQLLYEQARLAGVEQIIGEYIPTEKNSQVATLYAEWGGIERVTDTVVHEWELSVTQDVAPSYITIINAL